MRTPLEQIDKDALVRYGKLFLLLLLFFFIFLRYSYPVYYGRDTDVFWHLKTGEIIYNEHHILSVDPFTYTPNDPSRERFLMRSYWLGDLILYLTYAAGGFAGLVLLRAALMCGTVLLVYIHIRNRGFFGSIILMFLLGLVLMPTSAIRPNLFSIFFTAVMIFYMEKYKENPKKGYRTALFGVMLTWANIHGGYILGAGILLIYLFAEMMSLMPGFRKEESTGRAINVCMTAGISVAATFINPSGLDAFLMAGELYFKPSHRLLVSHIETEMGLVKNIVQYPNAMILLSFFIVGVILIYASLNLKRKKAGLAATFIVFTLFILTLVSVRVLPIFMVAGLMVSGGKGNNIFAVMTNKAVEIISGFTVTALLVFFIYKSYPLEHLGRLVETDSIYLRMGEFLGENKINGNMLNQEITGNFIIYKLFPKYKVFTDSRYINMDVFVDGLDIFYATKESTANKDIRYLTSLYEICLRRLRGETSEDYSKEHWYRLIEKYKIDFIVGRISHPRSGMLYPLFLKLMYDDNWKLIYMDGNALVMIKDNHKNDSVMRKFPPIDKTLLYDQAIKETITKDSVNAYETLAFAFLMKGDIRNSEKFARNALSMKNNLKIASACIQYIEYFKAGR